MKREQLIAPNDYNIVMEIEKFAQDETKQALVYMDGEGNKTNVTYQQLMNQVNRIGNVFLENGLQKGDKILIMVPRIIEAYEVYLAALKTGIIIVPSSEMLRTEDLQYRVTHGGIDGVVCYHQFTEVFEGVKEYDQLVKFSIGEAVIGWHDLNELKNAASEALNYKTTSKDDIAFLPYTSGTTGNPKAAVHTHAWGYAHLRTVAANWLDINETDIVWATAAPGWQKWVWSPLVATLGSGATGFIYNGKFNPEKYLELLEEESINVLCCTPTEYRLMAKSEKLHSVQLKQLHSAVSAGEPLNSRVIEVFRKQFNIHVRDGYGQTESTLLLGIMKDMEVMPGSMGKPTPGNEVDIVDEAGKPVAIGETGDIAVHVNCPALFQGYYMDEEKTAKARRGDFFVTGDRAKKDEHGYFWFQGRSDDIIISSGYTIGPFEVEDVLVKHPAVAECAVVGSPDEDRGQVVKAFIILKKDYGGDQAALMKELQNFTKQHTAPYKYPRKIEFVDELPSTSSGKIRRVALRDLEKERYEGK